MRSGIVISVLISVLWKFGSCLETETVNEASGKHLPAAQDIHRWVWIAGSSLRVSWSNRFAISINKAVNGYSLTTEDPKTKRKISSALLHGDNTLTHTISTVKPSSHLHGALNALIGHHKWAYQLLNFSIDSPRLLDGFEASQYSDLKGRSYISDLKKAYFDVCLNWIEDPFIIGGVKPKVYIVKIWKKGQLLLEEKIYMQTNTGEDNRKNLSFDMKRVPLDQLLKVTLEARTDADSPGMTLSFSVDTGSIVAGKGMTTTGGVEGCFSALQVRCPNADRCVSPYWICDGSKDCPDGSDEKGCEQSKCEDGFSCWGSTTCLPSSWRCDGYEDCSDGEDELGCGNCHGTDLLRCGTGNDCVSTGYACDGQQQCPDGWDESKAVCGNVTVTHEKLSQKECPKNTLPCSPNGGCITEDLLCNGIEECPLGEDESSLLCSRESKCAAVSKEDPVTTSKPVVPPQAFHSATVTDPTSTTEPPNDSQLSTMASSLIMEDHLLTNTLHSSACRGDEFDCGDGWCVPLFWLCDGRLDCLNGEDEEPGVCSPVLKEMEDGTMKDQLIPEINFCFIGQFKCSSGLCIAQSSVCDGNFDCPGAEDESDCTKLGTTKTHNKETTNLEPNSVYSTDIPRPTAFLSTEKPIVSDELDYTFMEPVSNFIPNEFPHEVIPSSTTAHPSSTTSKLPDYTKIDTITTIVPEVTSLASTPLVTEQIEPTSMHPFNKTFSETESSTNDNKTGTFIEITDSTSALDPSTEAANATLEYIQDLNYSNLINDNASVVSNGSLIPEKSMESTEETLFNIYNDTENYIDVNFLSNETEHNTQEIVYDDTWTRLNNKTDVYLDEENNSTNFFSEGRLESQNETDYLAGEEMFYDSDYESHINGSRNISATLSTIDFSSLDYETLLEMQNEIERQVAQFEASLNGSSLNVSSVDDNDTHGNKTYELLENDTLPLNNTFVTSHDGTYNDPKTIPSKNVSFTVSGSTNNDGYLVLATTSPQVVSPANATVLVAIHGAPLNGAKDYVVHDTDGNRYKYQVIKVIDTPSLERSDPNNKEEPYLLEKIITFRLEASGKLSVEPTRSDTSLKESEIIRIFTHPDKHKKCSKKEESKSETGYSPNHQVSNSTTAEPQITNAKTLTETKHSNGIEDVLDSTDRRSQISIDKTETSTEIVGSLSNETETKNTNESTSLSPKTREFLPTTHHTEISPITKGSNEIVHLIQVKEKRTDNRNEKTKGKPSIRRDKNRRKSKRKRPKKNRRKNNSRKRKEDRKKNNKKRRKKIRDKLTSLPPPTTSFLLPTSKLTDMETTTDFPTLDNTQTNELETFQTQDHSNLIEPVVAASIDRHHTSSLKTTNTADSPSKTSTLLPTAFLAWLAVADGGPLPA